MSEYRETRRRELNRRQHDWARLFLDLHRLTASVPAHDFIECLADVASLNGEHGTGDAAERAAWCELSRRVQAQLDHNSLCADAVDGLIEKV